MTPGEYSDLVEKLKRVGFSITDGEEVHSSTPEELDCCDYAKFIRLALALSGFSPNRYADERTLKSTLEEIISCILFKVHNENERFDEEYLKTEVDSYFKVSVSEALLVCNLSIEIMRDYYKKGALNVYAFEEPIEYKLDFENVTQISIYEPTNTDKNEQGKKNSSSGSGDKTTTKLDWSRFWKRMGIFMVMLVIPHFLLMKINTGLWYPFHITENFTEETNYYHFLFHDLYGIEDNILATIFVASLYILGLVMILLQKGEQ